MAVHFMIDLETTSTATDAGILQIGIQVFDSSETDIDVTASFLDNVKGQDSIDAGLRVEWSTMLWWMSLDDDARVGMVAKQSEAYSLSQSLGSVVAFGEMFGGWKNAKVWSNGAGFDIPILETAFRRFRWDAPWAYNNVLDVRTMKWLCPNVPRVDPETAHNALSDAQAQARFVQKCYAELTRK